MLPLLPLPFWLLGAFNLAAAAIVLVVYYREWSWRVTLAVVVIAVGMVAATTKAGMVMATWPRLPGPAIPHDGQITGAVGEPTLYGWRRLEPHRRLDVVVAVPAPSFRLFRARDLRRAHEGPPEPPMHGLEVRRDDLVDIEGVRLALIPGDAFTLDGLSPDVSYWICVGSATDVNRWYFVTCDRRGFEIPGRVWIGPDHPSTGGGWFIAPSS